MRKGCALRSKSDVFGLYLLQFKTFRWPRNLIENKAPKGVPNRPQINHLDTIWSIIFGFTDVLEKYEILMNLRIAQRVTWRRPGSDLGAPGAEGRRGDPHRRQVVARCRRTAVLRLYGIYIYICVYIYIYNTCIRNK